MRVSRSEVQRFYEIEAVRNKKAQQNKAKAAQSLVWILEDDEWAAILAILAGVPEQNEEEKFYKQRLKMIIYLLYFTGVRVSELVHCDWSHFKKVRGNWWLYVIGKGSKQGKIPINDALLIAMAEPLIGHAVGNNGYRQAQT